jgi:hypothetical protein
MLACIVLIPLAYKEYKDYRKVERIRYINNMLVEN